ncbi:MAG: D-alanyl-D-alanine carboxypeptidase [Robiginitomaculum sp.]|nr:MAG: D-alanyl-D-alanine carboxypeptidase [Robiginitomaculum sp.]
MKRILILVLAIVMGISLSAPVWGKPNPQNKYASLIIDVDSLEILHARKIDGLRYPASLTKMMTLYLVFDALERGELSLDEPMLISARASRTPPGRLGLRAGRTITVEQAIQALTVKSANDVAVVLAERLGGSEKEFAGLMTQKAKALGMQRTVFRNANGLPDEGQFTTARDMGKLAEALLRTHRKYYPYFSQKTFSYKGRTYINHNTLLDKVDGVDGFKTGYTNASGYNLVLSAERGGRRLIAVVLGGASGRSRDTHMADLIERGFNVKKQVDKNRNIQKKIGQFALNADERKIVRVKAPIPKTNTIHAYTLRAAHNMTGNGANTVRVVQGANGMRVSTRVANQGWAIQVGAFSTAAAAKRANLLVKADASLELLSAEEIIIPVKRSAGFIYRARLGQLNHAHAENVCKTLAQQGQACLVVAPS